MYKAALTTAIGAALLSYLVYLLSSQSIPDFSNSVNSAFDEMSVQAVSRRVAQKVFAVETAEVSLAHCPALSSHAERRVL